MNKNSLLVKLAIVIGMLLFAGCTPTKDTSNNGQFSFVVNGKIQSKFIVDENHYIVLVPENKDHMSAITVYIGTPAIYDGFIEQNNYEFVINVDVNEDANRFEVSYESFKELTSK